MDHCGGWRNAFLHIDPGPYAYYRFETDGFLGLGGLQLQPKCMPTLESLEVENDVPKTSVWSMGIEVSPHDSLVVLRLSGTVEYSFQADISQLEMEVGFPSKRNLQVKSSRVNQSFGF